jgi:hypothetical protein
MCNTRETLLEVTVYFKTIVITSQFPPYVDGFYKKLLKSTFMFLGV